MTAKIIDFNLYKDERDWDSIQNKTKNTMKMLNIPITHYNVITLILIVLKQVGEPYDEKTLRKYLKKEREEQLLKIPSVRQAINILVKEW